MPTASWAALLRAARQRAGLTQVQLAELLGVTQPTVAAAERSRDVTESLVTRWAKALGIEAELRLVRRRRCARRAGR